MKHQQVNVFKITSLCLILLFFGLMSASVTHAETYTFVTKWGSYGSGDGQFSYPSGVAVDLSGNVYVADWGNYRIQKFDGSGTFLTQWGSKGSGDGQFDHSYGVAVDSSGNVYVADTNNNRIQKFDGSGTFLTQWGSYGSGDGQFNNPRSVAVDSSGNVYVADRDNQRIQKFDGSGTFLTQWGSKGSGDGQFKSPSDVAVDSSGKVYVADWGNYRIEKFDGSGTFLTQWGSYGSGDGQFNSPRGVAVDSSVNVYVTDYYNNRIQKFDSNGNYITQWGSGGSSDGQFKSPWGVAVDSSGKVYVADRDNQRIQKFAGPVLPVANFSSNVTSGSAPLSVRFTDLSENATGWSWDFGDGTNSTEQNITHNYFSAGNYTVNLTVSNENGTDSKLTTINVSEKLILPVANFSANPTSGTAPLNVSFTDTSIGTPTAWEWNFGDRTNSTEQNPVHKYSRAGNYTVALTAINAAGNNTITKKSYIKVTAVPPKPVANFTSNVTNGSAPLTVQFTDLSKYAISWSWSFGDRMNSTEQNPVHSYSRAGNYTVNLIVTNAVGNSTLTKKSYIKVTAAAPKPVANFTSNVTNGSAPLTVQFTDFSKYATSWEWNFGDRTNSTEENPTHKYSRKGNYTVALTATNTVSNNTMTKKSYIKVK